EVRLQLQAARHTPHKTSESANYEHHTRNRAAQGGCHTRRRTSAPRHCPGRTAGNASKRLEVPRGLFQPIRHAHLAVHSHGKGEVLPRGVVLVYEIVKRA